MISMTSERGSKNPGTAAGVRPRSAVSSSVLVLVLTVGLVGPTRQGTS
jgi:hypothetical protein